MTITLNLTKLSFKQWKEVLHVGLWVVIPLACAVGVVAYDKGAHYLATAAPFLATPAVLNVLGVIVKGVFTQEESTAMSHLPADLQAPVQAAEQQIAPQG